MTLKWVARGIVPVGTSRESAARRSGSPNVVILSPHPDDDVIGAGGAMALLAHKGFSVYSLYVTHGAGGPAGAAAPVRRREALGALNVVGAAGALFLDCAAGDLCGDAAGRVVTCLREVAQFLEPRQIYVPSPLERHPTHLRATGLMVQALRQVTQAAPELWGYAVWSGLDGTAAVRAVDISSVIRLKRRAVRRHQSQLACKAYDAGVVARNRCDAVFLETHARDSMQYAELFMDMSALVRNRRLSLAGFAGRQLKPISERCRRVNTADKERTSVR